MVVLNKYMGAAFAFFNGGSFMDGLIEWISTNIKLIIKIILILFGTGFSVFLGKKISKSVRIKQKIKSSSGSINLQVGHDINVHTKDGIKRDEED